MATIESIMPQLDSLGPPDKRLFTLDDQSRVALTEFKISSMSVAVVLDQQLIYLKGFDAPQAGGYMSYMPSSLSSSASNKKPADGDTVYALGTGGDAVLSIAVSSLVSDGTMQFDTPVQRHLPSFVHPNQAFTGIVTLSDLLAHRSGLPSTSTSLSASLITDLPLSSIPGSLSIIQAQECPPFRSPRSHSTLNSTLAALMASKSCPALQTPGIRNSVSSATHIPVEHLIKSRVWAKINASKASGVQALGKEDTTGGITSSAKDLSKLLLALLGKTGPVEPPRKPGAESVLDQMWKPVGAWNEFGEHPEGALFIKSRANDEVGGFTVTQAGWMDAVYRGRRRLSYFGGLHGPSGTAMQISAFPNEGFGVVVLCNGANSYLPIAIANIASDLLLDASPAPWIERFKNLANPLKTVVELPPSTKLNCAVGAISIPNVALQKPNRPLEAYLGHYTCKDAPGLMFNVMSTVVDSKNNKSMIYARQVTSSGDGGQFTCMLAHLKDETFIQATTENDTERILQTCTFVFEIGLNKQAASFTLLSSPQAPIESGLNFKKTSASPYKPVPLQINTNSTPTSPVRAPTELTRSPSVSTTSQSPKQPPPPLPRRTSALDSPSMSPAPPRPLSPAVENPRPSVSSAPTPPQPSTWEQPAQPSSTLASAAPICEPPAPTASSLSSPPPFMSDPWSTDVYANPFANAVSLSTPTRAPETPSPFYARGIVEEEDPVPRQFDQQQKRSSSTTATTTATTGREMADPWDHPPSASFSRSASPPPPAPQPAALPSLSEFSPSFNPFDGPIDPFAESPPRRSTLSNNTFTDPNPSSRQPSTYSYPPPPLPARPSALDLPSDSLFESQPSVFSPPPPYSDTENRRRETSSDEDETEESEVDTDTEAFRASMDLRAVDDLFAEMGLDGDE
ncbi:hypothetical protein HDV05_004912 [Chytridiales sp. JEL 0842]|nr:hypothetical protein HDV05_004912 [Chytridiales sp. JEL 0842]